MRVFNLEKTLPCELDATSPELGITKGTDYIMFLRNVDLSLMANDFDCKIYLLADETVYKVVNALANLSTNTVILTIPHNETETLEQGRNYIIRLTGYPEQIDQPIRIANIKTVCFA